MKGAGETNVWALLLDTNQSPLPHIQSTQWDLHPQYSPDGHKIAFTSNRSGTYEIWVSDAKGKNETRLTQFNSRFTSTPRWSSDGKKLVYTGRPRGEAQVFIHDIEESDPLQVTADGSDNMAASWSRDGDVIYFSSNRSGTWGVWKMNLKTKSIEQITWDGGYGPVESLDGESVFYTRPNENGLWTISTSGGASQKITDEIDTRDWGSWDIKEGGIYFITRGQPTFLAYLDFSTQVVDTLYVPEKSIPRMDPALAISPDRKTLLFGQVERNESDLMFVEL